MSKLKNFVIVALIIISVVQIYYLWDIQYTRTNIARSQMGSMSTSSKEATQQLVQPYIIMQKNDAGDFVGAYNTKNNIKSYSQSYYILEKLIRDSELVENVVNDNIIETADFVYMYNYEVTADMLAQVMLVKNNKSEYSFDRLYVEIDKTNNNIVYLYMPTETDRYNKYKLTLKSSVVKSNANGQTYYVIDNDTREIFVPIVKGNEYYIVTPNNEYAPNGEIILNTVEQAVDVFFGNNVAKWGRINPETEALVFSDKTTVVKYYKENILEYAHYQNNSYDDVPSLYESFAIAKNFISVDKYVVNDYYLSNYTEQDGVYTFYFDYTVNGYPVLLEDTQSDKLKSHIEITVSDYAVSNYKKVAQNYIVSNDKMTVNKSFDDIMSNLLAVGEEIEISDVTLGYYKETEDELLLYWFIKVGNNIIRRSAQMFE